MNIVDLAILKKMVAGGGGSGTDNYNDLSNLPQINGETLAGNKTAENLGLQDALTFDSEPTEDSTNPVESGGVFNALAGKQDNLTFDGVYNASTNKAATESTVTNAIAGLDVSALSVDADETISSISENDGKISVTKQDIAIASNQVVAMTGYTKPSSAPATPAIQQGDTANAAIGKLEYKADVNQTNILYTQVNAAFAPSSAGWYRIFELGTVSETDARGANDNSCRCIIKRGFGNNANEHHEISLLTTYEQISFGVETSKTHSSDNSFLITKIRYVYTSTNAFIDIYYSGSLNNPIQFMLTENYGLNHWKAMDAIISVPASTEGETVAATYEFQPNYDLTRLEAEDRASLAEVVDSGAKNIVDLSNTGSGTHNAVTFTNLGNNVYKVNGTPSAADTHLDIMGTWSTVPSFLSNNVGKTIVFATNHDHIYYGIIPIVGGSPLEYVGGNKSTPVAYTIPSNLSGALLRIYVDTNHTYSNVNAELLACTKAAFGVSNKFVPYRPNYDLVQFMLPKSKTVDFTVTSADTYQTVEDLKVAIPSGYAIRVTTSAWRNNSITPTGIRILTATASTELGNGYLVSATENPVTDQLALSTTGAIKNIGDETLYSYIQVKFPSTGTYRVTIFYDMVTGTRTN